MRKIEALVQNEEVGEIREALRAIGVRTLRLSEAGAEGGGTNRGWSLAQSAGPGERKGMAKVGLVVPDHLTDRVILTLLGITGAGPDGSKSSLTSIERIVPLDPVGLLDDFS